MVKKGHSKMNVLFYILSIEVNFKIVEFLIVCLFILC